MNRSKTLTGKLLGIRVLKYKHTELEHDPELAAQVLRSSIRAVKEYAQLVRSFYVAKAEACAEGDDSSPNWTAIRLLSLCDHLEEQLTGHCSDLAIQCAMEIATLHERLRWLWVYGGAAVKGLDRLGLEKQIQVKGAKGNKRKARDASTNAIEVLCKLVPPARLTDLTNSALANHLVKHLHGDSSRSPRTLRGYISTARKDGLLPPRTKNLAKSN